MGSAALPSPTLHRGVSQQEVQAKSFVRSPITMQPLPHTPEHSRCRLHIRGAVVEFSVVMVYDIRLTVQKYSSGLHFLVSLE